MLIKTIHSHSTPYGGRGRSKPVQNTENTPDKRVDILVNLKFIKPK